MEIINKPSKSQLNYIKLLCNKIPVKEIFKERKEIINLIDNIETKQDAVDVLNFLSKYKDYYPYYNVFDLKIQKFLIRVLDEDEPDLYFSSIKFIRQHKELDFDDCFNKFMNNYKAIRPYLTKNKSKVKIVFEHCYDKVQNEDEVEEL